ncbi:MAG: SRPBCC family protein [Actinobacteria bacterium]|nr:SRPBCC family protein [Actinomycetota bacterium]
MDVSAYTHSDSITIDRPPEEVYAIVSDVTRVGELSPVCQSGSWDDAAQAGKPGAWFTGHNAIGDYTWDTHCKVVAAEPGLAFSFVNHGPTGEAELVRWSYTLERDGDGTSVTESWQVLPAYPEFVTGGDPTIDVKARIDGMAQMARDGIRATLANLKRIAES